MQRLEDEFPELRQMSRKVTVFKLGEEPPAYTEYRAFTPAQRWRHAEILRRIAHGYDPDTVAVSPTARVVVPGAH